MSAFQRFFEEVLHQCQTLGLAKCQRVMTDSTLVAANAALDSLIKRTPEPNDALEGDAPLSGIRPRKISNKTHMSRSDPDATLAKKAGTANGLKYKAHIAIDANSRVIVATHVTTGAVHDSKPYLEQLDNIQALLKCFIFIAIADRAYGTGEILARLIQQNITPIIPLFSRCSGGSMVGASHGFHYEAQHRRYRCPSGQYLMPYPSAQADGREVYRSHVLPP